MRPSVRKAMEALAEAGRDGLLGTDIARLFDEPESLQRRLSWVGNDLCRCWAAGYARRSSRPEPSPHYHHAPVYRWFITPEGKAALDAGLWDRGASAARRREAAERKAAERKARREAAARRRELVAESAGRFGPGTPPCERLAEIRRLRGEGCALGEIGPVFGITGERVRQLLAGAGPCPCCGKGPTIS